MKSTSTSFVGRSLALIPKPAGQGFSAPYCMKIFGFWIRSKLDFKWIRFNRARSCHNGKIARKLIIGPSRIRRQDRQNKVFGVPWIHDILLILIIPVEDSNPVHYGYFDTHEGNGVCLSPANDLEDLAHILRIEEQLFAKVQI